MNTNKSVFKSFVIALAIGLAFGLSSVQAGLTVDYLIVGGGGGGGGHIGGGGGAGGLITSVVDVDVTITPQAVIDVAPGTYSVTVGAGGTGGSGDGAASILALGTTNLTALGGGGGGDWNAAGHDGGSGGGGGQNNAPGSATQPAGGFGNDGATSDGNQYIGGGGGGAGAAPGNTPNGGSGLTFDITGTDVGYGGGGGGGKEQTGSDPGTATHGGGEGGDKAVRAPAPGVANTGGGGGGRGSWTDQGDYGWFNAAGGSGIVVLRYDMSQRYLIMGGTYSTYEDGGITYAVHQFTTVGDATFTVSSPAGTVFFFE